MAGISTYNINIKDITDVAERDIATKAVEGIKSPGVVAESGNISKLIDALRSSGSKQVVDIANKLALELLKAVMSAMKGAGPELAQSLTQSLQTKEKVTTQSKEQVPPLSQKKERIPLPSQTQTAAHKSLISSSDVLMSQIQKDFINFKVNFAKSIRTQLTSSHGKAFQVIGKGAMPYTRRGGAEVLKIANIDMLIGALKSLTNISEKQALALVKERGPGELVKRASRATMKELSGGFGKTQKAQTGQAITKITEYINKHGYEGLNTGVQKIIGKLKPEGGVTEEQIKKALLTKKGGVSPTKLQDLMAETSGRSYVQQHIGAAISEIEIPRPQAGPQGLPSVKMQSGRHRALAEEYRFTPGIMVASQQAQQIIGSGKVPSEAAAKVQKGAKKLPQMLLEGRTADIANQASNIMGVMKTDKKGRLDLINAYRETITSKKGKVGEKPELKTKEQQLGYLDKLSDKAKRLSIGFDDVLVAMGKFSRTGIYDRLHKTLTAEGVGVTSPVRTTVEGLATDPQAIKKLGKRIKEPFIKQELVEEDKPRLGSYQSRVAKLNVPRLAPGGVKDAVSGEVRRQELVAHNRELEKYLSIKGKQYKLSSQGMGESRSVVMDPDVTDPSRQLMNMYSGDMRELMPFGKYSNLARTVAPTYHGLGGAKAFGGEVFGGLEVPLVQSKKGRAAEKEGVWGKGGYGLNLQTEIRDTAGNFEDQIEVAGKAVNRFATYIKPKIKDVKDIGGAEVVAKDIVSTFAPEVGKAFGIKEPGKAVEGTKLITEISKILTGPGGESLNTRAVKIVEQIFTQLGTKMTTHAGSKGTVTFGTGKEGELGYTKRRTEYHELMQGMLRKKREAPGVGKKGKQEIDALIKDLDMAGSAPFVGCMHKNLSKEIQEKYKKIRENVNRILDFEVPVTTEKGVSAKKQTKALTSNLAKMKEELGPEAMFKTIPTEVRMSLTGATKRLNLGESLETAVNNVLGNVKGALDPLLTRKDLAQEGEFAQTLQAFGFDWGPEASKSMKKRTLPMYSESVSARGESTGPVIAGSKFFHYTKEPAAQEEWSERDIGTKRKGQKLNAAAMAALTSVFGEEATVTKEAMGGYRPRTGQALENIMALKSLGEESIQTKEPYIPTTGMRELPGVISKYQDLHDTILDTKRFGAGGFAEVPEFEEGKETGKRPLYVPSRESIGLYAEQGGGVGANKLATIYGSLLTNVEEYEKAKTREYPKGEKANVDILRKNVKGQIGKTSSDFRKMLESVTGGARTSIGGEDLKNLINYFKKLQIILQEARAAGDPALGQMATPAGKLIGQLSEGISNLEGLSKSGKGVTKTGVYDVTTLLRKVKDSMLEPKVDTAKIKSMEKDLRLVESGGPLTDMESYYHYRKKARSKEDVGGLEGYEAETPEVRKWLGYALRKGIKTYSAGKGKPGLLSTTEGGLGVAAEQFGITTDPKKQAIEERQKAIERDKYRLKKELVESTAGHKKGAETLQTRTIPAISGTVSAAINTKVEDFKAAAEIIKNLGADGVLGDTSGLMNALKTQTEKHEKAVKEESRGDRVVLREGEVGLPAGKLEKLKGEYGAAGESALDAVRAGQRVDVMTTRFPMTGVASHQFLRAREVEHPSGRGVVSLPGVAPGIDVPEMENIIGQLKKRQTTLREERAVLPEAKAGTATSKQLDAQRASLTKNINALSKAIDLVTVKFSGFAQNADVDGDTMMVHAGKTKAAQKEISAVTRTRRTGIYGEAGALDPRAFINQMMNYNIKKQTSSMAELADLYATKAKMPSAKLFQTPQVTKDMEDFSIAEVAEGLAEFGVTPGKIEDIAKARGFTEPKQKETVAREVLYEEKRKAEYGKLYVKTGLGESTEAINKVARFMDASVGFGGKQIGKKEYAAWKPESAALGAVYGKGGALTQRARPGREMQTMMNVLLEQVINQAMSAKTGGKATFQEVTQGMASGTLFGTMEEDAKLSKKDQRFSGITKANEIIKTVIRDRLDALNAVDFAAEAKRHKTSGKGRAAITDELVSQFSFEGFLGAAATDIQNQMLGVETERVMAKATEKGKPISKKAAQEKAAKTIAYQKKKGSLDLGMYFPQMQPEYSLRTSSASIEKLAKQTKEGKTKLDKAITTVLRVIKSTGTGVSVSDTMMHSAFEDMFRLFRRAEELGVNLEKMFAKATTVKQKRGLVSRLERKLGMPKMSVKEKEMIKEEGETKLREKYPEAKEEDIGKFREDYLFQHRKRAIKQHAAATESKKQFMAGIVPSIGAESERRTEERERVKIERDRLKQEELVERHVPRLALGITPYTKTGLGDKDLAKQFAADKKISDKKRAGELSLPSYKELKKAVETKPISEFSKDERLDFIHAARGAITTKTGRKQRKIIPEDEEGQIKYAKNLSARLKELDLSVYKVISSFNKLAREQLRTKPVPAETGRAAGVWKQRLISGGYAPGGPVGQRGLFPTEAGPSVTGIEKGYAQAGLFDRKRKKVIRKPKDINVDAVLNKMFTDFDRMMKEDVPEKRTEKSKQKILQLIKKFELLNKSFGSVKGMGGVDDFGDMIGGMKRSLGEGTSFAENQKRWSKPAGKKVPFIRSGMSTMLQKFDIDKWVPSKLYRQKEGANLRIDKTKEDFKRRLLEEQGVAKPKKADGDWRQQLISGGYAPREPAASRLWRQRDLFPTEVGPPVTDIEKGYTQAGLFDKKRKKPPVSERTPHLGVAFHDTTFDEEAFKRQQVVVEKFTQLDKERFEKMSKKGEEKRGYALKYPGPLVDKGLYMPDRPEESKYLESRVLAQQAQTQKATQIQTYKQTEFKVPRKGGAAADLSEQESKLAEAMAALRGGAKGKDYAALTEAQTNKIVKTLQRYTKALNLLLEGASDLTATQSAKIEKAADFIKQNIGTLAAVPAGTKLGAAAKSAVGVFKAVGSARLEDFAARAGVSAEEQPPKPVFTGKYKTELEALQGFVAAAKKRTGYSPEGKSERIQDLLASVREAPGSAGAISQDLMKEVFKEEESGRLPKQKGATVWRQYHLEKVRGRLNQAMEAEAAGSVYDREEAIGQAKDIIRGGYASKATPFLTRAEGDRGRVTGYADEEAASTLGLVRMPTAVGDVGKRISKKSETAGAAVAPVLFGAGRMEERLKAMWARIRNFAPELAKAGKAFNFDTAQADLAIIKDELKGFKFFGDFSSEEAADIDHAISKVTKMQKAVQEAPEKALPALAIPELETPETATAAFENQIAATMKEMEAQKDLAVGETRKVVAKIPTAEGQIERREVTLVARGPKEGLVVPGGRATGVERVEGKPTVMQREMGPSRRSIRLLEQFGASTDSINKKIQQVWLGIKRFDKAAGTVDFSEALEDLTSMQMLIAEMLKDPLLSSKQFGELSQLKRQLAPAARAVAGTPAEGMKTVIMKGMETPESAKAAFKEQVAAQKAAFLEQEDLAIGQKISVAATLPTRRGVTQRKQVQLTAVGEGGVVTGIEEQEYKPADKYLREATRTRRTKGALLVKQFASGTDDIHNRITKMLLGVKNFNLALAKSGQYSKAISFKGAEKNLVEIMNLLDRVLKGAALLTEEERAAYKQAQLAAKAMYQKVVKTPVGARKGITVGGYETPESSLAAFRARLEEGKRILEKSNQIGKSMVIKGKLISETGEEVAISKRLTARGSKFFGMGGPVTQKSVKEREEVGGGQVGSVIRRVAMWGAASGAVYGIIGGVRQMLQTMTQAETGLVNLKKVMSHVTTDFDHMRDSAVRFAKDYGAELMGVFETMRIFAQQGLPQDQVKEMARVATLAANVTTMKPPEAAEALTSATRQFNIEGEKSISILDSWNEVENKFAITAKDLADGFKKAGTAAKITGIDVNKLNGIITAIGEATRQTGKEVGTSLKFIFSRMATEKAPRAMKAVGVETMEGGRLREGSAILDDLAKRWVSLTRSQKLATSQAIGGIRHYNALMVLMDNYDRALAATAASINSVGSAEKENKMIMETYAKKVAQMKASFDALAVSASGPVLASLGKFADALKGIAEAMAIIPGGALAGAGAGAYMGATALGKYFDLSMFGLLGSSVGGAPRKKQSPMAMLRSAFGGKEDIGRDALARGSLGKVSSVADLRREKSKRDSMASLGYTEKDISKIEAREAARTTPGYIAARKKEKARRDARGSLGQFREDASRREDVGVTRKTTGYVTKKEQAREAARKSLGQFEKVAGTVPGYAPIPTPTTKPKVKTIPTRMLPTKRVSLMAAGDIAASGTLNKRIDGITKGLKGMGGTAKRAGFSLVGMFTSLGLLSKILIPIIALGIAIKLFGNSMSKTFASAKDRTEGYRKSLEEVEERLTAIGDIKLLRTRIEISAEKRKSLEALTPEQVASQVEGRSYKSPILMRKQQIENVKEYAGAVASMTSAGLIGFDSFGKAVVVAGDNLGGIVDSLEEIANKARVELKLHIEGERLEDLMQPPELDTWFERQKLRFREFVGSIGKSWGAGFMEDYAESKRNPFESLLHSVQEIDNLRAKAGAKGRVISPPSMGLKETKPKQYKEQKKEYEEWIKAQQKRLVASKRISEEFQNIHREFFTMAGPGMTPKLAGRAAFGRTGGMLAELEKQKSSQFYEERGVSTEDIQTSFMHRLRGVNVRASAELTREAAMEQGIPVMTAGTEEGKRKLIDESRAKDILMFKEGAGFLTNQVSVFERAGELLVQYATKTGKEAEKTLEEFKEMPDIAKNFVAVVSSMGMLTPLEARLKEVSKVFVGAEAGMFKPQKDKTLELGKKYRYQAPTEMLIQNDAYKMFSKGTTSFIGEYIKKQADLRSQQKAALSIYEKRGALAGETATNIQLLTSSLIKFSNTAIQSVRAVVELEKSLEQLEVGYKKQAAVQEFRSENLVHMTGLLAGEQLIREPKIDMRKTGALSTHERLITGDEGYKKTVKSYNKGMDRYNAVVKRGEMAVQAAVDIGYVKDLAKEKPEYSMDVEEIAKGISKTGDLASGSMLAEMEKQTNLEQQSADSLKTLVGLSSKGGSAGLELLDKATGLEGGERSALMGRTATAMKTDLSTMFAQGDIQGMIEYNKEIKERTKQPAEKTGEPGFGSVKYATAQFLIEMGSYADAIRKEAMIKSGVLLEKAEIGKKPTEEQKLAYEAVEKKKATPEQERIVGEEQYNRLLSKGHMAPYLKSKVDEGVPDKILEQMKIMFEGKASVGGEGESSKVLADNLMAMEELGKKVEGEAADLIEQAIARIIAELTPLQKEMLAQALVIEKTRRATDNFNKASGQLEKSVLNLVDAFRDLDRQSVINQKLIETRSKYLSTRGGPMRQKAPSADIDVATTAQYSPHELLYNKSKPYKDTVTGYLKTAESLKAARSKVEEIAKIEGKAEYMRGQGISEEKISGIIDTALMTGSMESALMVTEQEKTNTLLEKVNNSILGIYPKEGEKGDVTGKGEGGYKALENIKKELNIKARYAEQENIEQAEYLRAKQIEKKTALDIAAGRGKTQDQVNREESELLTGLGYVPEEIKDRNKKLVQVHKEEKASREEWERAKQKSLKPLQQSAGGMQSLIDSITSGVTNIKGARNIRPLERGFAEWTEAQGTGESAEERVADQSMQFDLAKSLYSQNLNLRAQGADTGVAPRKLYDIMERASKGEDVTDELEQIQSGLAEKKKEREEQIRKIQAEEYARAVKEVITPADNKLGAISGHTSKLGTISDNTGKLITTMSDVGQSMVAAINTRDKESSETAMTAGDIKTVKDVNAPIITLPEKGESMSDFTARMDEEKRMERTKDAYSAGLRITPVSDEAKGVYGDTEVLPERIKEKFFDRAKQKGEEYEGDRMVGFRDAIGTNVPARIPEIPSTLEVRKIAEEEKREPLTFGIQEGITMQKYAGYAGPAESDAQFYEGIMKGMPKKEESVIPTTPMLEDDKSMNQYVAAVSTEGVKVPEQKTILDQLQQDTDRVKSDVQLQQDTDRVKSDVQLYDEMMGGGGMGDRVNATMPVSAVLPGVDNLISEDSKKKLEESTLKKKTKDTTKAETEQKKETKNVNDEMSDLKDEIVTLKTSVSDVNKLFEKLSKSLDDVSDIGDKSKDSAASIETLGKSASEASSSLDTLSTKMDNIKSPETETAATMMGEEGYEYISEDSDIIKDLIERTDDLMVGVINIEQDIADMPDNSEIITELVNKTDGLVTSINSIEQNMLELSEGLVTTDSFADFKNEISGHFEEISELKTSVEDLNKDMILNNDYTVESKKQFEIIIDRLQTYDTAFTKIEENISFMDHKFTDAIAELHEMVVEAKDQAWAAYNFASQAINQI